jgi:hypothetical protein
MEYFVALLWLLAERDWASNKLTDISLSSLIERAGRTRGGSARQTVRDALNRLAGMRISGVLLPADVDSSDVTTVMARIEAVPLDDRDPLRVSDTDVIGNAVRAAANGGDPIVSPSVARLLNRAARRRALSQLFDGQEKGFHTNLLSFAYDGEFLTEIALSEMWCPPRHGVTAWFDYPAYFALDNHYAQRLLQLMSAAIAETGELRWERDMRSMARIMGLGPVKPSRVRDLVTEGADRLKALGLAAPIQTLFIPNTKTPRTVYLEAGRMFRATEGLQGLPVSAPFSLRTQLVALKLLGHTTKEAAELIEQYGDELLQPLLYIAWLQSDDPASKRKHTGEVREPLQAPRAYLRTLLERKSMSPEPSFRLWAQHQHRAALEALTNGTFIGSPPAPQEAVQTGRQTRPTSVALPPARFIEAQRPELSERLDVASRLWQQQSVTRAAGVLLAEYAEDGGVSEGQWTLYLADTGARAFINKPERLTALVAAVQAVEPELHTITVAAGPPTRIGEPTQTLTSSALRE